jgi:hypothetical protein
MARTNISEATEPKIWIKSSLSFANGDCVEVAFTRGGVSVRDSKAPDAAILRFTRSEWEAFIGGVQNGEFDAH